MIVRDLKRTALVVGPLVVFLLLSVSLWRSHNEVLHTHVDALLGKNPNPAHPTSSATPRPRPLLTDNLNETHTEIFSSSTVDRKHFEILFGDYVFNPNIIAHPTQDNTWFIVGQRWSDPQLKDNVAEELGCLAQFMNGVLMCIDTGAQVLPYAPTTGDKCEGPIEFFNLNVGPHDARVFYGPHEPYTIYGSNSGLTCFGQWIQDFRKVVGWERDLLTNTDFEVGTELHRPAPYSAIEKNWFVFWDKDDQMHGHYDIFPTRSFARLSTDDGSAGPDLAPAVAAQDQECMVRYLPQLPDKLESIHQATNSLRITLCNRADSACQPDDTNTFILIIIQHKTYYDWHSEYEPYVVLFAQRAPYELHAISKKPLWIHGRQRVSDQRTQMFYVTSINWKQRGVKYHGYLDDELFLGFGIEDRESGAIDVKAADLLVDLGLCGEMGSLPE